MNNIPSHSLGYGRINPYRQSEPVREAPQQTATAGSAPVPAHAPAAPANGLSAAEQQMIDRYFPAAPALTLRLYGADRHAQQVNPHALGGRLDLRG